jgi:hypothetical protein
VRAGLGPGHPRITGCGDPGPSLDLPEPLGLVVSLSRHVGLKCSEELSHDPGPLIGRKLEGLAKEPISSARHAGILRLAPFTEKRARVTGMRWEVQMAAALLTRFPAETER